MKPSSETMVTNDREVQPLADEAMTQATGGGADYVQREYYCPDCRRSFIKEKKPSDHRPEKCPVCKKPGSCQE